MCEGEKDILLKFKLETKGKVGGSEGARLRPDVLPLPAAARHQPSLPLRLRPTVSTPTFHDLNLDLISTTTSAADTPKSGQYRTLERGKLQQDIASSPACRNRQAQLDSDSRPHSLRLRSALLKSSRPVWPNPSPSPGQ